MVVRAIVGSVVGAFRSGACLTFMLIRGLSIIEINQNSVSAETSNTGFGTRLYVVPTLVLLESGLHFVVLHHSTCWSRKH